MGGLPEPRGGLTDKAVAGGVLLLVALGSLHSVIAPGKEPLAVTALTWALIAVGCGALYFSPRFPVGGGRRVARRHVRLLRPERVRRAADDRADRRAVHDRLPGRLQAAVAVAALLVIATGESTLSGNGDVNAVALFMMTGWVVAMVALGWARHSRRVYLAEAETRAARRGAAADRPRAARRGRAPHGADHVQAGDRAAPARPDQPEQAVAALGDDQDGEPRGAGRAARACSACCATADEHGGRLPPRRACDRSTTWWTRREPRARRSTPASTGRRGRCPRASTSPPTGSSRRR